MTHELPVSIQERDAAERFAGAGGDEILVRLGTGGSDPVTVVEGVSEDREWAPQHSHPWDELTYVLEGTIEFRVGDLRSSGGPGALVSLPRGVPHTLRVPEGEARYLMITLGAPSLGFLRDVGQVYADGPTLERLLDVAAKHGVKPALEE
ncbi:MAG: cupin domain-containing protein [Dehalococcoidia bacterium]